MKPSSGSLSAGLLALGLVLLGGSQPGQAEPRPGLLSPCRVPGSEVEVLCGSIARPLRPGAEGPTIDIHFAVLPAVARNKKPDPVFFFAGGPGQAATRLLSPISTLLKRLNNRRDIVFIDQRGTGRSAPLYCPEQPPTTPLKELMAAGKWDRYLSDCLSALQALPHGDLRYYATPMAMADADAVREALGASQINVIGGSYGTRAALDYLRQFPGSVRRTVIDGVAPPDGHLPDSLGADVAAAFSTWLVACESDAPCQKRYPGLRATWARLLASLPREVTVAHPFTGVTETLTLTREDVLGLVRSPLYVPSLASALPLALSQAAAGHPESLLGLSLALSTGDAMRLALGMHFSVICTEDFPLPPPHSGGNSVDASLEAEFQASFRHQYQAICDHWPRGTVPAAFHSLPTASTATLVFSGGLDPVTPPRHGERVAAALGGKARHVRVENAGHGVLPLPCIGEVLHRFIDAPSDREALAVDASCAAAMPRPPFYPGIVPAAAPAAPAVPAPKPEVRR